MRIVSSCITAGVLLVMPPGVGAQRVVNWDEFEPCQNCRLTLQEVARLGDRGGDGVLERGDVRVIQKPGVGYVLWSEFHGQSLSLFDEGGGFVRRIGSPGEGPGELAYIEVASFNGKDQLVVLDQSSRLTTFDTNGAYVGSVQLQAERSSRAFQVIDGDSTAILGLFGRRPESVGYPLHPVDVGSGAITGHFGSTNPASWSAREPQASVVLLGRAGRLADGVWWSKKARPHIEHWGLDGTHRLTITGDLDWYPKPAGQRQRGSPWGSVTDVSVDGQNRLWLMTWAPDPDWQDVQRGPEGGITLSQTESYWDSRLDVFDLTEMRHLGSKTWDGPFVKLLNDSGSVHASLVEYQTPTWPRAVIYTVDVQDSKDRR